MMQNGKRYWQAFALVFVLFGLIFGGWLWFQSSLYPQSQSPTKNSAGAQVEPTPTQKAISQGGRLVIPSLHIDAPIEAVGVLPDGSMGVPTQNQWDNVGWYKYGVAPGERGSAVIDGHLDRPGGKPAVFWKLRDLRVGDSVMVVNAQGKTFHFRVTKMETYTPEEAPREKIFADTSGTYLNLITCVGEWIPARQQTTHRLVVYTSLVS